MANPDWKWLETFVRAAEKGSLSAAAVTLGTSQPTASRNLRCLEEQLGARLFVRHSRGLELTERGLELFAAARSLDEGVQAVFRKAAGLREEPAGTVRISVSEPMGVYVLPTFFAKLRADFPKIALEVVIDNAVANLSRRDADIAVRMFRPEQLALVARRVGAVRLGLFATRGYLRRMGVPVSVEDLRGHTLVGSDRDLGWARAIRAIGLSPADFKFRTDSLVAQVAAILHGVGIGGMHARVAARHPTLVRVLPDLPFEPIEAWLVMHEDLRSSPAVRAVFAALLAYLQLEIPGSSSKSPPARPAGPSQPSKH